MTSSPRKAAGRSRFTTFDWLAMTFLIFGFVLVLGGTTFNTVTGGDLVVVMAILAGAFIVRGGASKTIPRHNRGAVAISGRSVRRTRTGRPLDRGGALVAPRRPAAIREMGSRSNLRRPRTPVHSA